MTSTILKDILIEKNQIDRYFDGCVPVDLWRAVNRKSGNKVFDFVEEGFVLSNGRPRPSDIKIEMKNGIKWVYVKDRPRGLSTFDKKGLPRGKNWEYYKISQGTILPKGIAIVKDEYNSRFEATHYTIAPAYDMALIEFKYQLNLLAKLLIKEAV